MSLKAAALLTIGAGLASSFFPTVGRAQEGIAQVGREIERVKARQKELNAVIDRHSKRPGKGSALAIGYAQAELDKLDGQTERLKRHQGVLERAMERREQGRNQMVRALAIGGVAQQALDAMAAPIRSAISFETAMLGVAKQVPGARDENGKLTKVYDQMVASVHKLGRELPITTNEIAEMMAAGARMDVPEAELEGFVRTAGMMSSAFEMPADQLAEQMGKVAKVYGIPIPKIGELADVVNYLDDNAISKGGDIINVLQRIGGTAATLGMSAKDAAALGSTFLTLGASAEVAATASNAVMRELSIAASQPKRFQKALGKGGLNLGMSAEGLQASMAKDATGTIMKVLEALNKLPKERRLTVATELFGKEYGDDVSKLAVGIDEYKKQINLARSKAALGSMKREHEARMGSIGAQWAVLQNIMTEVSVTIGKHVLPAVTVAVAVFGEVLSNVADFLKANGGLVDSVMLVGAGFLTFVVTLRAVRFVSGLVTYSTGALTQAMTNMKTAMTGVPGETNRVGSAFGRLGKRMRSGPFFVALGLFAGMGYVIYRNWDSILAFFNARFPAIGAALEKVGEVFSSLSEIANGTAQNFLAATPLLIMPLKKMAGAGGALQALGGKFLALGKLIMGHPLLIAATLLAGAAYLVYRNWEPIKTFFMGLWEWVKERFNMFRDWLAPWVDAGVEQFNVLRDGIAVVVDWVVGKIQAMIDVVQQGVAWANAQVDSVKGVYDKARSGVSDAIESTVNFFTGQERVRADAPVESRRQPPPLPASAARTITNNQNNAVTIHVAQMLGEDMAALARRIREEQERAIQAKVRGSLFDTPAMAY